MLVKIFGSAVFGVEATTITVDVFIAALINKTRINPLLLTLSCLEPF